MLHIIVSPEIQPMSQITCFHCARPYDDTQKTCPHCGAPAEPPEKLEKSERQKRFVWMFIALVIFCAIMIVWLPRYIPPEWSQ